MVDLIVGGVLVGSGGTFLLAALIGQLRSWPRKTPAMKDIEGNRNP
jgi:hypothetical protein